MCKAPACKSVIVVMRVEVNVVVGVCEACDLRIYFLFVLVVIASTVKLAAVVRMSACTIRAVYPGSYSNCGGITTTGWDEESGTFLVFN